MDLRVRANEMCGAQSGRATETSSGPKVDDGVVLVGACDSSSRERTAPPDTTAEHLRSDPRWLSLLAPLSHQSLETRQSAAVSFSRFLYLSIYLCLLHWM